MQGEHIHRWLVATLHQDTWKVSRNYSKPSLKSQRTPINSRQALEVRYRWWDGCNTAKSSFQRDSVCCPVLTDTRCSVRSELHKRSPGTFEGMGSWGPGAHVMQYDTSHSDTIEQNRFTFAVAFIPGKDAILNAITHQRCVDAHVAVAKECTSRTGGWKTSTNSLPAADIMTKTMQLFFK